MTPEHAAAPPSRPARLGARLEAMRASGMSATAICRTLGLSEAEAVACGLVASLAVGAGAQAPGAGLPGTGPSMLDVVDAVARAAGVPRPDLLGPGQARALSRPRQLAMHLLHERCAGASLPAIGHLFGRDHTTVLYGCRRAAARLAADAAFRGLRARALAALEPPSTRPGAEGRARG